METFWTLWKVNDLACLFVTTILPRIKAPLHTVIPVVLVKDRNLSQHVGFLPRVRPIVVTSDGQGLNLLAQLLEISSLTSVS